MIYIKLDGHDFEYEIKEVVRLFYSNEEILILKESLPPVEYRGIFLLSQVIKKTGEFELVTCLEVDNKPFSENTAHISLDDVLKEGESEYKEDLCNVELHKMRRELKKELKRQIYFILEAFTGNKQPWGVLTGIRPAKIVCEMLDNGLSTEEILFRLKHHFKVSEQKVDLVMEIAKVESKIINASSPNAVGIYIGIPFCPSRCLYCSFTSNPIGKYSNLVESYLEALKHEIEVVSSFIEKKSFFIESLYIGGGTPTSINASQLNELLKHISKTLDLSKLKEFDVEAGRPDSLDKEKLLVIKQNKVDRISINPQTMNDETLKVIGRRHTSKDTVDAFRLAREIGFRNINMDIIIGLPGENLDMFESTLKKIKELKPESLTVHTMSIKRASRLNEVKDMY
jgi:coproporphyrinogen dehydrogenase HemZ